MDKETASKIIELAQTNGYEGFASGKYHCNGSKTAVAKTLFSQISFPGALKSAKLFELALGFRENENEILEVLRTIKYRRQVQLPQPQNYDFNRDMENSRQQIFNLNKLLLFKSVKSGGIYDPGAKRSGFSVIAFNPATRMIINSPEYSVDGIMALRGMDRKDVSSMEEIPHVWPVFNPYTPEFRFPTTTVVFGKKEQVEALNTAIPPKWMTDHSADVTPGVKGFIRKLTEHLFPDPEERERVLDWCHYAIFKRNGTVLCLAGDRGTGKSTFVEILGELVGQGYTELVSEAILKEKFNSQFYNKRLIVFEEVALAESSAINKVKAWCNAKISIEEKGSNAFSADNFSSMVFLLNDLMDLKINAQERRFSIPVVAEENLTTAIPETEISRFKVGMIEGHQSVLDEIAEFGLFLKERKPKNTEYIPIKGRNFNRVADMTLTEWQVHLRDYVQNNGKIEGPIPISDIFPFDRGRKESAMKFPTNKSKIDAFLRDYRFLGKYKIGDIVDLSEEELTKYSLIPQRKGPAGGGGNSRTRRMYGVRPREDFLRECGIQYKEEDLL